MKINRLTLSDGSVPETLARIPSPPKVLYHRGAPLEPFLKRPRLAIVGTRSVSAYGRQVTLQLARELAGQGIVIIGGLAFGVDALVHQATLEAGGNRHEQTGLDLLLQGVKDGKKLLKQGRLTVSEFNQVLTMLERGGKIRALGGNQWALY